MTPHEKIKSLWQVERRKHDMLMADSSAGLERCIAQSGYVIGIADAYIKFLEDELQKATSPHREAE